MNIISPSLTEKHIGAEPLSRAQSTRDSYLFSPLVDFLCLGGGSLLLFIPMMFLDVATFEPTVAATILFLAHFINSPHFAHSYQIFYRNFSDKAFGPAYSAQLRVRYIVAGIVAPVALIIFLPPHSPAISHAFLGLASTSCCFS